MNDNNIELRKTSRAVDKCQISDSENLISILFLGFHPPVNSYIEIGEQATEQSSYPCELIYCPDSNLVQLGLIVDPKILFPSEYPYTSGTTKLLRDNFAELYQETTTIIKLEKDDLVIDIGSNDGTLLGNFKNKHRVLGITPEEIGQLAIKKGIPTIIEYFDQEVVDQILSTYGKAKVVTATNVFAHIDNANKITQLISCLLEDDGIFISESHYLGSLIETLQYDTIYHEHLRYYSLSSLKYLLDQNQLDIIHAKKIPTHGGSIRVYATKDSNFKVQESVPRILEEEQKSISLDSLMKFKQDVLDSKLKLLSLLNHIKSEGDRIFGIGSPSRASTLINYTGIDNGIIDCIVEVEGSYKIGKYMPGTRIPVLEESILYEQQPEYAILFSWHIADELIPKIRNKGYQGKFITPLPDPKIIT